MNRFMSKLFGALIGLAVGFATQDIILGFVAAFVFGVLLLLLKNIDDNLVCVYNELQKLRAEFEAARKK